MDKLSINTVQNKLIESHEYRQVSYDKMKKNGRMRAIGALDDPSTQIINIKQVSVPKDMHLTDTKGQPLFHEANFAGEYVDKMDRGIFEDNDDDSGKPTVTPTVKRMSPNQSPKQNKVNVNMTKGNRKSETSGMQIVPRTANMAGAYVDAMPRGNIFSDDTSDGKRPGGPKVPEAKNLHGTTRPKSSKKTANMNRHPDEHAKGPNSPSDNWPTTSDAPKARKVEKVKSGILVRVNESIKAQFDIVSESVLRKMIDTYHSHGYRVVIENSNIVPAWKNDQTFLQLVYETVGARENQSNGLYQKLRNAAQNRLYQLCQRDYNNLYESRNDFLNTIRTAFTKIEESAIVEYRKNLNLYIGKVRIMHEGKLSDIELLSEAIDQPMALRLIRNKIMESFGLDTSIRHIFIDGNKYDISDVKEFIPRIKGFKF